MINVDDIAKLNSKVEDAREGCNRIDETLNKKLLSVNYEKSKKTIKERTQKLKSNGTSTANLFLCAADIF